MPDRRGFFRSLLKPLRKLDAAIGRVEGWSLVAILTTMMLVAFTQVVLRNLFSTALSWGDGLTRALVLWAGFVGASLAVREGRFINVDAVSRALNDKQRRIARYFIYAFATFVCLMLGRYGVDFVRLEYASGGQYSIGVSNWIIELIIPITFFFISFRFLLKVLALVAGEPLERQEWER